MKPDNSSDPEPILLRFPDPKASSAPPSPKPDPSREYSRSLLVVVLVGAMLMFGSWARNRNAPMLPTQTRSTLAPTSAVESPQLTSTDGGVFGSPSSPLEPAVLSRRSDKPVEGEATPVPAWTSTNKPALTAHPIPVNRASADELLALPGIGRVLAQRIVDERDRRPFATVEDMRRVSGIGAKRLEQLRPLVTIR